jgi:SAM-dependent methyltransferase
MLKKKPQFENLWYSLRRYYVDEFYFRHVPTLPVNTHILDLGGTKIQKRGQFDVEQYEFQVWYANLLTDKDPDVQCDAAYLPFKTESFDSIISSEVLELVPDPLRVLHEMSRVLRSKGIILICIPFLYRVQGHPYDYGRYTDSWWLKNLTEMGFMEISIEWQGFFSSVLVDMLRDLAEHKGGWSSKWLRKFFKRFGVHILNWGRRNAILWDEQIAHRQDAFAAWYCSYTTGFGIRAVKP